MMLIHVTLFGSIKITTDEKSIENTYNLNTLISNMRDYGS